MAVARKTISNNTAFNYSDDSTALVTPVGGFDVDVGDLIVVSLTCDDTVAPPWTITDTAGNTYTAGTEFVIGGSTNRTQMFYSFATGASSANRVTATPGSATPSKELAVSVYTGVENAAPTQPTAGSANPGTSVATSSFSLSRGGVAVAAYRSANGGQTYSPTNSFSVAAAPNSGGGVTALADRIYSGSASGQTAGFTFSSSDTIATLAMVFLEEIVSTPNAPTGVTVGSVTAFSASVSATDNSSDETGFRVEVAPSPYSSYTSAGTTTSFPYTISLNPNTSYRVRVYAYNANGDSTAAYLATVNGSAATEFTTPAPSYARPASDITTQWSSTAANLWSAIDETSADDADYIYATAAAQTAEVKLGTVAQPTAGTELRIKYKVTGTAGGGKVTAYLYCGATLIATDTQRTADGTYTMTVASTAWDTEVTDWSDLRLRFVSA